MMSLTWSSYKGCHRTLVYWYLTNWVILDWPTNTIPFYISNCDFLMYGPFSCSVVPRWDDALRRKAKHVKWRCKFSCEIFFFSFISYGLVLSFSYHPQVWLHSLQGRNRGKAWRHFIEENPHAPMHNQGF